MQKYRNKLFIILVILLSFFTVIPLFHDGFFPMHDNTQVTRVVQMHQSLADGMFPVRWVSDLGYGYGYPIFSFYAPLAYYVGAAFMALGLSAVVATKLMIGLGLVLAGVSMYILAKEFWGVKGGIVASVFYALAPYHGTNVYVRGAISEMWAYAFIPLAFYGVWKFSKSRHWQYFLIGSIGVAGIILSHNLTAMMVIPFLVLLSIILAFINRHEGKKMLLSFLIITVGILLSSFYWMPTLLEISYTNVFSQTGGGSDYKYHFVCLQQFWTSPIGYGGSSPGCIDGMSFQLGKIHIMTLLLSVAGILTFLRGKKYFYPVIFAQIIAISGVFLATNASTFLWEKITIMRYFQFPWRFETLFFLGSSFLSGCIFVVCSKYFKKNELLPILLALIVILISVLYYQKFFVPQSFLSDAFMQSDKSYIRAKVSRISDEYLPKDFSKPEIGEYVQSPFPSNSKAAMDVQNDTTQYKKVEGNSQASILYITNIAYFPSWKIYVNSKEVEAVKKDGRVAFSLPKGRSNIEAKFVSSPIEAVGNMLSLAGILSLSLGIISFRHKDKNEK